MTLTVPGICYPDDVWYYNDPDTGVTDWHGRGLWALQDLMKLLGHDRDGFQIKAMPWDKVFSAVANQSIDVAPYELGFNMHRFKNVDFSLPVSFADTVIVSRQAQVTAGTLYIF